MCAGVPSAGVTPATPGWTARLTGILGARLDALDEEHLRTLVDNGIREDADLDFKQERYGKSDQDKRANSPAMSERWRTTVAD